MTGTKTFDCVEMKRQGQRRIRERLQGMTAQQQIDYWRKRSEEFLLEQERLRARQSEPDASPLPNAPKP